MLLAHVTLPHAALSRVLMLQTSQTYSNRLFACCLVTGLPAAADAPDWPLIRRGCSQVLLSMSADVDTAGAGAAEAFYRITDACSTPETRPLDVTWDDGLCWFV